MYGNSSGAIIALSLLLRHPEAVTRVMLHEPPLMAGLTDPSEGMGHLRKVVAEGKAQGGTSRRNGSFSARLAWERRTTGRFHVSIGTGFSASGAVFLTQEFDHYEFYNPPEELLVCRQ